MDTIDSFLNRITMYRVVLYALLLLIGAALVESALGLLPFTPFQLVFSVTVIGITSWITNTLFATVFEAIPNAESVFITALILAVIISPVSPTDAIGVGFLIFAAATGTASKYIFAIRKQHIFNPAAVGVAVSALCIGQSATWWVAGTTALLPFVLVGGFLVARKVQRLDVVSAFVGATLLVTWILSSSSVATIVTQTFLHSSLLFFAFFMLTEPLTMPPSRFFRIVYALLVGTAFAPQMHIGSVYFTPEVALLLGNLYVALVSPRGRFALSLVEKREIATDTYELIFSSDRAFHFLPGQYMEWTLRTQHNDSRGNRRYFTIASSPTEKEIRLGVKCYEPRSRCKEALLALRPGDTICASHLAGDFVLPKDKTKKLVFIAGGIGITPFRSMVQYLYDTHERRDITLLYSNKTAAEIAYRDVFDRARDSIGLTTIYALTNEPEIVPGTMRGYIDRACIEREVPDYRDRLFYVSGPQSMVRAFRDTLAQMGVPRTHITTDFFPGFA